MKFARYSPLLLALALHTSSALSAEHAIDTAHSKLTIHVGKAGLFSAAGHEHTVVAPIEQGTIDEAEPARVRFTVKASALEVQPEPDQAEVQKTMQSTVLGSDRYPEIRFESTSVRKVGDNRWTVTGNLTLHGATKTVIAEVQKAADVFTGEAHFRQSDFGIRPVTAAGGTVKVKDELKLSFVISLSK